MNLTAIFVETTRSGELGIEICTSLVNERSDLDSLNAQ